MEAPKKLSKDDLVEGNEYWVRQFNEMMVYQGLFGGTGGGQLTCGFRRRQDIGLDKDPYLIPVRFLWRDVFLKSSHQHAEAGHYDKVVVEERAETAKPPEHPAAALVRSGYICEAMGNGGWLVRPNYRMYDPAETKTMSAFTSWPEMMDWLRAGHEVVAPTIDAKIARQEELIAKLKRGLEPRPLKEAPYNDAVGGLKVAPSDAERLAASRAKLQEAREGGGQSFVDEQASLALGATNALGWTEWRGAIRAPVPPGTLVAARLRDGVILVREARNLEWDHGVLGLSRLDIVAFKLRDEEGSIAIGPSR